MGAKIGLCAGWAKKHFFAKLSTACSGSGRARLNNGSYLTAHANLQPNPSLSLSEWMPSLTNICSNRNAQPVWTIRCALFMTITFYKIINW